MLFIFYRFLPKSTACPNFIYFYDHNVESKKEGYDPIYLRIKKVSLRYRNKIL